MKTQNGDIESLVASIKPSSRTEPPKSNSLIFAQEKNTGEDVGGKQFLSSKNEALNNIIGQQVDVLQQLVQDEKKRLELRREETLALQKELEDIRFVEISYKEAALQLQSKRINLLHELLKEENQPSISYFSQKLNAYYDERLAVEWDSAGQPEFTQTIQQLRLILNKHHGSILSEEQKSEK